MSSTKSTFSKIKDQFFHYFVLSLSAFIIAFNIKVFVSPAGLMPGGMGGITLLIQTCFRVFFALEVPYTAISLIVNLIPIFIGFRFIGKRFTLDSCLNIVLVGIITDLLPDISLTDDILILSLFGGFLHGLGVYLALSTGATSGGFDFISIFMSEKKNKDSWNLILILNSIIIVISGALFGWKAAFYSIIFQYVSTKVLHLFHKDYQKQTFFIITEKPQEICDVIYNSTHHGATILKGFGPFAQCDRAVVYSVIGRSQVKSALSAVKCCDPSCGINSINSDAFVGDFWTTPRK